MKLNYRRTVLIGLAFLSISGFWQMYDNIIPLILQDTFHLGETVTGAIMAVDNVLAIILLPVIGALSDRTNTKYGKRTPYIVIGTILALIFLILLPIADNQVNFWLFVISLFALLVSMGLYRSPTVALMPDLTPNHLRSKANAIINLMGAVGAVYALVMIKLLVSKDDKPDYLMLFLSIAGLMFFAVLILVITIHEKKISAKVAKECEQYGVAYNSGDEPEEKGPKTPMPKDVKRSLIFLLASIFLWFFAYNAVTTAFSRYTKVVWGMKGGGFADCLMVAMIAAILSYIPIGIISSKIGRKKTILIGISMMTVCYFLAIFATSYHPVINVAFAIIGIGWAAISVNSYPMIVEMSKGSDIGKFTGTYYTFSMAAQIITPIVSGALLENVSYRTLFPYAVVFSGLAFVTMLQVKHGDSKPLPKKSTLESFDIDD